MPLGILVTLKSWCIGPVSDKERGCSFRLAGRADDGDWGASATYTLIWSKAVKALPGPSKEADDNEWMCLAMMSDHGKFASRSLFGRPHKVSDSAKKRAARRSASPGYGTNGCSGERMDTCFQGIDQGGLNILPCLQHTHCPTSRRSHGMQNEGQLPIPGKLLAPFMRSRWIFANPPSAVSR